MIRGRLGIAILFCALVGLVGGCASTLSGKAVAAEAHTTQRQDTSGEGSASNDPLGEVRTVDPCSFIYKHAFDDLAPKVKIEVTGGNFGACDLWVKPFSKRHKAQVVRNGKVVTVKKRDAQGEFLLSIDDGWTLSSAKDYKQRFDKSKFTQTIRDGYTVYKGKSYAYSDPKAFMCIRGITVSDHTIVFTVSPPGKSPVTTCDVADAALDSAFSVLKQGKVRHRQWPAGSPAGMDLCEVLDATSKRILGVDAESPDAPGVFGCYWATPSKRFGGINVRASEWPPTIGPHKNAGKGMKIAGRPAFCLTRAGTQKNPGSFGVCNVKYGPSPFSGDVTSLRIDVSQPHKPHSKKLLRRYATAVVKELQQHH